MIIRAGGRDDNDAVLSQSVSRSFRHDDDGDARPPVLLNRRAESVPLHTLPSPPEVYSARVRRASLDILRILQYYYYYDRCGGGRALL